MEIEYIITYSKTVQVSNEEWAVINPTFKVSESTTIAEIIPHFKDSNSDIIIREVRQLKKLKP
jgi:hypothetical protein